MHASAGTQKSATHTLSHDGTTPEVKKQKDTRRTMKENSAKWEFLVGQEHV
jgi:hypothetical protein